MREIQFRAINVKCSEAIDWEIMQVQFDSTEVCVDEESGSNPYLLLSVNFEFGRDVSIEFYDGSDYGGGRIAAVELWRTKCSIVIRGTASFDIGLELSDEAFAELRYYLTVMIPAWFFQDHCLAEYGPPLPPPSPPDDDKL